MRLMLMVRRNNNIRDCYGMERFGWCRRNKKWVGRSRGKKGDPSPPPLPFPSMANNGENTISELDTKSKSRKELRIQGREARQGTKEALSSTASSQLDTSDGVGSQNTRHTRYQRILSTIMPRRGKNVKKRGNCGVGEDTVVVACALQEKTTTMFICQV